MTAKLIQKSRIIIDETAFYEVVLRLFPEPVLGSKHPFKYGLALVVNGECVLRHDNERGKGDHQHIGIERNQLNLFGQRLCMMILSLTWKGF